MPGLVPGIHVLAAFKPRKAWMAGTSPAMTKSESFRCSLFARRAGVHVDFHAHRHFNNLWSFPGHFILPSLARHAAPNANLGLGSTPRKCGASRNERECQPILLS